MANQVNPGMGSGWDAPDFQRVDPSLLGDDALKKLADGAAASLEHYRAELVVHGEDVTDYDKICRQRIEEKVRLAREEIKKKEADAVNYYTVVLPAEMRRRKEIYLKRLTDIGVEVAGVEPGVREAVANMRADAARHHNQVVPPPSPTQVCPPAPMPVSGPPNASQVIYTLCVEMRETPDNLESLRSFLIEKRYEYSWIKAISKSMFILRMKSAVQAREMTTEVTPASAPSDTKFYYYFEELPSSVLEVEVF